MQVELRNGPAHGKRTEVPGLLTDVSVPTLGPGGFGVAMYSYSGLHCADGAPIFILRFHE